MVHSKHPDWALKIYGDGVCKEELQKLIDDMDLSDSVSLEGNTHEVANELSKSSIFALSSEHEGFCLSLLEAISCGLPVVVTETTGAKEIVRGHNCGFLTKLEQEEEMSARICELIENPSLMKQMHLAALKRADDFSLPKIMNIWVNLFENMMN